MEIEGGSGLGLLRSTSFGRKRVALFRVPIHFGDNEDSTLSKTLKRHCSLNSLQRSEKSISPLEDLPQDILIRILCGVEHDDLRQLLLVSKAMKEAALIARQLHFAFCTPRKALKFPNAEDIRNSDDTEPPNAPKRSRVRFNLSELSSMAVDLFGLDDDDCDIGDLPSALEMEED